MALGSQLLKLLPEELRFAWMRRKFRIPRVEGDEFTFRIARTQSELEEAFRLSHLYYARLGLMRPHPSGLRCNIYSALPFTTTVIAIHGGQIIGTVSLIKDTPVGFPSDRDFRSENDSYRRQGFRLVEISGLSIHPEFRERTQLLGVHLMKYAYLYARDWMDADFLCATVHPRTLNFYVGLLGFQRHGPVKEASFVQGASSAHIIGGVRSFENWAADRYMNLPEERNLHQFFLYEKSPFEFPKSAVPGRIAPVMTPELLEYFFVERTGLFRELTRREAALIRSVYELHYDMAQVPVLRDAMIMNRSFRYSTELQAAVTSEERNAPALEVSILDVSRSGAFVQTGAEFKIGTVYELQFALENCSFRLPAVPIWRRDEASPEGRIGYGFSFQIRDLRLERVLKAFHGVVPAVADGDSGQSRAA